MEDVEKKAIELAQRMDELEEEFERGLREKRLIMDELGITPEKLAAFEGKLSPGDRKALEEKRKEMEEQWADDSPVPEPPRKSAPRVKGIRV